LSSEWVSVAAVIVEPSFEGANYAGMR
jgi:hypothetical protein